MVKFSIFGHFWVQFWTQFLTKNLNNAAILSQKGAQKNDQKSRFLSFLDPKWDFMAKIDFLRKKAKKTLNFLSIFCQFLRRNCDFLKNRDFNASLLTKNFGSISDPKWTLKIYGFKMGKKTAFFRQNGCIVTHLH